MFTVITKDNEVSKHNSIDSIERSVEGPFLAIDNGNGSKVAFTEDSPITWPTTATSGMQAIVDVKAGTLRFGWGPVSGGFEFVVSEYVEPFVSVEDCGLSTPVHVLDLIKEWPTAANSPAALLDLPGFKWMFHEGKCWSICGMNGDTELFEGHWLNYHENKKKYANDHCGDEGIELTYSNPVTAASMLTAALGHTEDRAKTYDTPGGERSMGKTVAAFNAITGLQLSEEQGWLFMILLKAVRAQTDKTLDSLEDMVAYSALLGEAQSKRKDGEKSS